MMSTKMRSGWWSAIFASASKPFSARITWQPACMRKISALRRMVLLSSITITRTPVRFLESATHSLDVVVGTRRATDPPATGGAIPGRRDAAP